MMTTMTKNDQAVQKEEESRRRNNKVPHPQEEERDDDHVSTKNVNNGLPGALTTLHQSTVDLSLAAAHLALECQKPSEDEKKYSDADADTNDEHDGNSEIMGDNDDDENEIIPFIDQSSSEYYERKDEDDDDDNEEDAALTKSKGHIPCGPSTKISHSHHQGSTIMSSSFNSNTNTTQPVVVISLQKLCGYIPSTSDEYTQIQQTLLASLLGNKEHAVNTTQQQQQQLGDGVSMDFTLRSTELFDIGAAVHGFVSTSSSKQTASTTYNIWVPRCSCDSLSPPNDNDSNTNDTPFETCLMISKPLLLPSQTANGQGEHSTVIVPYPDYLIMSSEATTESNLVSTQHIWNVLEQQQNNNSANNDVVQWLYFFLRICNRTLLWKYQMVQSIQVLVDEETDYQISKEYQKWQCEDRTAKLEKLYEIRDLLEQQLEDLSNKSQQLKQERYIKVQQLMEQHHPSTAQKHGRVDGSGGGSSKTTSCPMDLSKETFDFLLSDDDEDSTSTCSADDHDCNRSHDYKKQQDAVLDDSPTYNGTTTASDYDNTKGSDGDDGDDDDDDGGYLSDEKISSDNNCNTDDDDDNDPLDVNDTKHQRMSNTTHRNSKRRHLRRRDILKSRQDKVKQEELQKQELKEARSKRRLLKRQLLKQHMTKEEITTKALEQQLRTKFLQTDELLENLQDEQWEYEEQQQEKQEDEHGESENSGEDENDHGSSNSHSQSLLDSILAMILGSLTSPLHLEHLNLFNEQQTTTSEEEEVQTEFYQQLKTLHGTILQKWKTQFGRLPPALVVPSSSTKNESPATTTTIRTSLNDGNDDDKLVEDVVDKNSTRQQHQQQQQHAIRDTWEDFDLDDDDDDNDDESGAVRNVKEVVASATALSNETSAATTAATTQTAASSVTSMKKKGLRPGGKVIRHG